MCQGINTSYASSDSPSSVPHTPQQLSNKRRHINTTTPLTLKECTVETREWPTITNCMIDTLLASPLCSIMFPLPVSVLYLSHGRGRITCIQIFIHFSVSKATQTKTMPLKNLHSSGKDQSSNDIPLVEEKRVWTQKNSCFSCYDCKNYLSSHRTHSKEKSYNRASGRGLCRPCPLFLLLLKPSSLLPYWVLFPVSRLPPSHLKMGLL